MSNLSRRVQKSKQITKYFRIGTVDLKGAAYSIFTFTDSGEINYETTVKSNPRKVEIPFGDTKLKSFVFNVECKRITGHCNCKGNERHTVCYHGFFALVQSLKEVNLQIRFYENVFDAVNGLNFGGSLAKVQSTQGNGIVWATVHRIKKANSEKKDFLENPLTTSMEYRVNLMRGSRKEAEGID